MTATYCWEHDDGNDYEIVIDFKIMPGERMTHDYPGSPAEVDWNSFTCKSHPEKAKEFEALARNDYALSKRVDEACLDMDRDMFEQSQCDD